METNKTSFYAYLRGIIMKQKMTDISKPNLTCILSVKS